MKLGTALIAGIALTWASTAYAGNQDFRLVNKTGYDIHEVYVSAASTNSWEEDVMGRDALVNGSSVDISFANSENACKWDLKAVYEDGEEAVWDNFDLCTISKITIFYNQSTGVTSAEYE